MIFLISVPLYNEKSVEKSAAVVVALYQSRPLYCCLGLVWRE